jgi:hypothetical protein
MTRRTRPALLAGVLALLLTAGRAQADPIFVINGVYEKIDPPAHADPNPPVTFTLTDGKVDGGPFDGAPVSDLKFMLSAGPVLDLLTVPKDFVIDPGAPEAIFHIDSDPLLVLLRDRADPANILARFVLFSQLTLDSAFHANPDLAAFRDNRVILLLGFEGITFTDEGGATWNEAVRDVRAPFSLVAIPEPAALALWGLAGLCGWRCLHRHGGACQKRTAC